MAKDNGQKTRRAVHQEQVRERVEFVQTMLGRHFTTEEIKREVREKFGTDIFSSTIQGWIRTARDWNVLEIQKARREQRAESLAVYTSVISDPNSKPRDRIMAQRAIDDLLGLRIHLPPLERIREYLGLVDERKKPVSGETSADERAGVGGPLQTPGETGEAGGE
ncbi:hypothetical protein KIH39_04685 [Telmatocola sphagniphila]|uniref:Uncharacterized protein n=1 Tax=Telmatocola sphagniphila TaxID=1123043 RepID=A0A8E6EVY4_9BACT|nr:hypothetical protein [Telmatocola sphagniphila]QVL33217.1 hypothetical protein KIH39_04685 [Telmatocola sphagniphila]